MRSNIARTWPSSSLPARAPAELMPPLLGLAGLVLAAQLRQEVDERGLLLRIELAVGRHRRRRVLQRAQDRRLGQLRRDVGQLGTRAVVAVLPDLVAGEAA